MNKTATSRQALLEAAREIARRDGLGHISIRRTAAMCDVSIGTVYNYYPAKADLVLAVIEDFWKRVFHGGLSCDFTHGSDFSAVCGQIYTALRTHLAQFEHTFLRELASLNEAERQQGKALEVQYWEHIRAGMLAVLARDARVRPDAFTETFTREQFVSFVFCTMMSMLRAGKENASFLQEVVCRLIY